MAWYTDGKHTSKPPAPVPDYQRLMGRARMLEDFASLLEDMGAPVWRVRYERKLADSCRAAADAAYWGELWLSAIPTSG